MRIRGPQRDGVYTRLGAGCVCLRGSQLASEGLCRILSPSWPLPCIQSLKTTKVQQGESIKSSPSEGVERFNKRTDIWADEWADEWTDWVRHCRDVLKIESIVVLSFLSRLSGPAIPFPHIRSFLFRLSTASKTKKMIQTQRRLKNKDQTYFEIGAQTQK